MDIQNTILGLVALAGFAMAGAVIYSARKPATVSGVLEATGAALTDIEKAAGAAKEYVLAAEQLWATGNLPADSKLDWVLQRLGSAFPEISAQTKRDSVEAAVAWMKTLEGRLIDESAEEGGAEA